MHHQKEELMKFIIFFLAYAYQVYASNEKIIGFTRVHQYFLYETVKQDES